MGCIIKKWLASIIFFYSRFHTDKKAGIELLSVLALIFGSVFVVNAVVFNSSDSINAAFSESLVASNVDGTSAAKIQNFSDNTIVLAKVLNEDTLDFDRAYKAKYLNQHKNFSNLNYKQVKEKEGFILTVGARNNKLAGYQINNKRYAVDLIGCNSYERYCVFRINGVPTKKISSFKEFGNARQNSFQLDDNFSIKVNSIDFDFCGNRRFCHLGYEGYHKVDISIGREE